MIFALLSATVLFAPPVVFVNVNVLPMDRDTVLRNQTVVIRGERIAAVGAMGKVQIPKDAIRIDGRQKFLMPGLVDMHVHVYAPQEFSLFLANGVTTVYNLNGRP
ncbi:MAG: amidohydrolase, partial [Chlorobia bacterium]|nr:amidohydrolase [Fimbriimonadaceae bacterium]